jgi:hypothetical protein
VAFDLLLDVDLVDVQSVIDGEGVAGLAVEQGGVEVKGIGQRVSGIDAHDQGLVAEAGQFDAGGGGKAGLPYASLAAEEEDAHTLSLNVLIPAADLPI